jgi:hypothetical protein
VNRAAALTLVTMAALLVPSLAHAAVDTGFPAPFAGTPKYQQYAPTQAANVDEVNQPLGQAAADQLAVNLGLDRSKVFTHTQYVKFVTGKGIGGKAKPAALVDRSVRILTNTTGHPMFTRVDGKLTPVVLGSYGVFANATGALMSPANLHAATRQVNRVIEPTKYLGTWCRANGAQRSLRMLYRSAYTSEVVYGNSAQKQSGPGQLVINTKDGQSTIVGMSMAPALWIVNFSLIYTLNPKLAANMPAHWTPVPAGVAVPMLQNASGLLRYGKYAALFPKTT